MKNKKKTIMVIIIFLIVCVLGYFFTNKDSNKKLEKTSIRLKWITQSQFAGFYTAEEEGIYDKYGLDVTIDPAGPNISPIQSVVSGNDEFGIAGADQVIAAIDNDVPIVAIGVIYRETPESLVSLKSSKIKKPKDLIGKTVGVIYGNDEVLYRMFLKKNGIKESEVNEVPAITGISQIMTNKVDAKMAYEMNDAVLLKLDGQEVNLIKFRDYGIKVYGDTIFTTKELAENNPEKVRKFVKASFEGWNKVKENPEKAVNTLIKINSSLDYDHQLGYLKESLPIIFTDDKLGYSNKKVWQNLIDDLYDFGTIKNKHKAKEIFTNKYLD
ncbi:MAG: ABC transporter substrate-binding protein [Bacilli bacterium]|nr:ABC transporter substrate-binding protein [Bacilli bacterium]